MKFDDLLTGFIRLHILHHAAEHETYGQRMIDELANHGYRLSPGTLYPMLHAMEDKGYLTSRVQRERRTARKL
jgi:DNA-binding PadR family transcriptional regulator